MMSEDQRLHLQFVQGVITRMNSNSSSMKGWMVAVVSALLALYANSENVYYIWLSVVPTLLFWLFDTYYLKLERQYRKLYNKVAAGDNSIPLYSMDASNEKVCYFKTLFRPIEVGIYLPIMALIVGLGLVEMFY